VKPTASGGESSVIRRLAELGFETVDTRAGERTLVLPQAEVDEFTQTLDTDEYGQSATTRSPCMKWSRGFSRRRRARGPSFRSFLPPSLSGSSIFALSQKEEPRAGLLLVTRLSVHGEQGHSEPQTIPRGRKSE
jgi:hypothetical protein